MHFFWLHIYAPFAAYRKFQAGSYISTFPVMPPSAAYGLVLNLMGIDISDRESGQMSLKSQESLPVLRIAIGRLSNPFKCTMVQKLHSYCIGKNEKTRELAKKCKGAKYWISPVRREFLIKYDGVIGVGSADVSLKEQISRGLSGELCVERYGLPFAGDSNLLFDRIEIMDEPPAQTVWYKQSTFANDSSHAKEAGRLTVNINRSDNSKTTSAIYAPTVGISELSEEVWTWVNGSQ